MGVEEESKYFGKYGVFVIGEVVFGVIKRYFFIRIKVIGGDGRSFGYKFVFRYLFVVEFKESF